MDCRPEPPCVVTDIHKRDSVKNRATALEWTAAKVTGGGGLNTFYWPNVLSRFCCCQNTKWLVAWMLSNLYNISSQGHNQIKFTYCDEAKKKASNSQTVRAKEPPPPPPPSLATVSHQLHPYFAYKRSKGSGGSAHLHRLARALVAWHAMSTNPIHSLGWVFGVQNFEFWDVGLFQKNDYF